MVLQNIIFKERAFKVTSNGGIKKKPSYFDSAQYDGFAN